MKKLLALCALLLCPTLFASVPLAVVMEKRVEKSLPASMEPYTPKDYSYLIGMPGFSANALNLHFKLYQGYVKNTNLFLSILRQYSEDGKDRTPQFQEIKRRLGWEYDGMYLHELYFSNLGGKGTVLKKDSPLYRRIEQDFGSYEAWEQDFIATGLLRGIGWVILYLDPIKGRLMNIWIGGHANGHIAGGKPILVMDVWEHAYLLDYGIDRMGYIKAFLENTNWNVVSQRFPSEYEEKNSRWN